MPLPHRITALSLLALATLAPHVSAAPLPPAAAEAIAAIERGAVESRSDAVLLMRGNEVLLERYSEGGPRPIELMSVTKSVVALGIGALLADGLLESLDVPVAHFYPEWKQGRKAQITVRMLMDHTSGLQNELRPAVEIYPAPDVIQLALAAELVHEPGKGYQYNNKAVNLLAGIIQRASGERMDVYLKRRLFDPLGLQPDVWYTDKVGNPHAMAGLSLNARDTAAIGRLVLDKGKLGERQLVPAEFIHTMLDRSRRTMESGLLWWRHVAWVRFHADAESIAMLEKAGLRADLLDKLRPLQGRRFGSDDELRQALAAAWGEDWYDTWFEQLIEPHGMGHWRPFHSEKGPVELFEANGSFGQYLIVMPKADLVAVRLIESRKTHVESDNYDGFREKVQALADALADEP